MMQNVINWFQAVVERVDEKTLVLIMIVLVVVMCVCSVVSVMTLDRNNAEMRTILDGILKEKELLERRKNGAKNESRGRF